MHQCPSIYREGIQIADGRQQTADGRRQTQSSPVQVLSVWAQLDPTNTTSRLAISVFRLDLYYAYSTYIHLPLHYECAGQCQPAVNQPHTRHTHTQ